ncbi:MAG: hypothetical protein ACE5OP_08375 [Candidatus Glassbacteria bacterium]
MHLLLFGTFLHTLLYLTSKLIREMGKNSMVAFHRFVSASVVTGILTCSLIVELKRPYLVTWRSGLILAVVTLASASVGGFISLILFRRSSIRRAGQRRSLLRRTAASGGFYGLLLLIFFLFTLPHHNSPSVNESFERCKDECYNVMLIGLDGATWRVIDRMMAEGGLPNIRRLVTNGVRADLLSEVSWLAPIGNISSMGMRSATVWTSIATGKSAFASRSPRVEECHSRQRLYT